MEMTRVREEYVNQKEELRNEREREREEAMKVKKADIMVKFKPNYRSVYRKFFFLWRDVYNNVLNNRAAGVIAVSFKRYV